MDVSASSSSSSKIPQITESQETKTQIQKPDAAAAVEQAKKVSGNPNLGKKLDLMV